MPHSELVKLHGLQVRRSKTAAKRIQNDPVISRFRAAQKHPAIQDRHFVSVRSLEAQILLGHGEDLRIDLHRLQHRGGERFVKKLIKSTPAQADHERVSRFGMKGRPGRDKGRVGDHEP